MFDTCTVTVRGPFAESLTFTMDGFLSFCDFPKDHRSKGRQGTVHSRGSDKVRTQCQRRSVYKSHHHGAKKRQSYRMLSLDGIIIFIKLSNGFHLTMREGDLEWFGGVSEVPHCQAAVRVAAHELLPFVMPANWMDGLFQWDIWDGW